MATAVTEAPPPTRRRTAVLERTWVQAALVAVGLFLVYYLTSTSANLYNHYPRLADAFLHGRLYLEDSPDYLELARYYSDGTACKAGDVGCRGYVIDPPAPALLLLPFVAVFGVDFNQLPVSLAVGAAAMGLFWQAACQLGWDLRRRAAMTALLALGTNFWWTTGNGALWMFAHVAAVFFMMAAMVEATGRRRAWLVGILLGLAGLSRLPCFLGFPFFLVLMHLDDPRTLSAMVRDSQVIRRVLLFGAGLGSMAAVVLAYNVARYGTLTDLGYHHPMYAGEWWFAQGRFDISYIPRHIKAILYFGPELDEDHFPYFKPSIYGMGLFMVTPAFLCAFAARKGRLEIAAATATLLVALPHVLHGLIGHSQYGYRFSLDYLPMLAVLTASGLRRIGVRAWAIIGLSVFVAMWGPLLFFETRLEEVLGHQFGL